MGSRGSIGRTAPPWAWRTPSPTPEFNRWGSWSFSTTIGRGRGCRPWRHPPAWTGWLTLGPASWWPTGLRTTGRATRCWPRSSCSRPVTFRMSGTARTSSGKAACRGPRCRPSSIAGGWPRPPIATTSSTRTTARWASGSPKTATPSTWWRCSPIRAAIQSRLPHFPLRPHRPLRQREAEAEREERSLSNDEPPANQPDVGRGQRREEAGEQEVPDHEGRSFGPIGVLEIEEVHPHASRPVDADEGGQAQGRRVAAQELAVQRQRERPEGDDGQHRVGAVGPHQFAVEGSEACQVGLPTQAGRHLEAGAQDAEVADAGQPEREAEELSDHRQTSRAASR